MQTVNQLAIKDIASQEFSFLVSYGYRHIIGTEVLDLFPSRAINLHISFLPWNRGADPNFWSFIEDTPKGVTIHYLDEGVDTGDIICQQELQFESEGETLASTYQKLHATIQELFRSNWDEIKAVRCPRRKQIGKGSVHKMADKAKLSHLLTDGWQTSVSVLSNYASKRSQ
ncbi:MAG: formyltransferase family protein [Planctomycetota bacterium]